MNVWRRRYGLLILFMLGAGPMTAGAANVVDLNYDAGRDQLVIQLVYRGTHPDHVFSIQWGECRHLDEQRSQILGLVVDSDPKDPAREEFSKRLEIGLAQFSCRPAKVTIRTDAGFLRSVDVPAPRG